MVDVTVVMTQSLCVLTITPEGRKLVCLSWPHPHGVVLGAQTLPWGGERAPAELGSQMPMVKRSIAAGVEGPMCWAKRWGEGDISVKLPHPSGSFRARVLSSVRLGRGFYSWQLSQASKGSDHSRMFLHDSL
jgi:hypothetical protein